MGFIKKQKFLVAAATVFIAGAISAGTVFADDNIVSGDTIPAEISVSQEADPVLQNGENVQETVETETDSAQETNPGSETGNEAEGGKGASDGSTGDVDTGNSDAGNTNTDNGESGDTGENAGSGESTEPQNNLMSATLSGQNLTVILNGDYSSATAAIWSETGGQDDIVWYPMTKRTDGSFMISADLGLHGSVGTYHIHVYNGNDYIAGKSIVLESFEAPEMIIETIANNESTIVVSVRNAVGYANAKVAVWGEKNGQNDLKWYDLTNTGNGTISAVIDLSRHGENGKFYFHAYGSAVGKERFLDGKAYNFKGASIPEPSVKADFNGQILTLTVENAGTYPNARAAVWSETGGQDDLKWYTLTKDQAGIFKEEINLAAHRSTGKFIIHIYSGDTCIGGETIMVESLQQPVLTAEKINDSASMVRLSIENAEGFTDVKAAVWGDKNGQNDLKWYPLKDNGNGNFSTETDLITHRENGMFNIHVYGKANGTETYMDGKSLELSGLDVPEPVLEAVPDGQIAEIKLSNVQEYPSARAAVWSEANGQDDLVWYPMTRNADGSFTVKVNLGAHKSAGQFNIHVYSGNTYVAGKSIEVEMAEVAALHVETVAGSPGLVTVTLSNASGFNNVRAAIWGSKNYQNDIRWYELKDSGNGSFRADVDLTSHGEEGYYYFHVYGQNAGADVFVDGCIADPKVPDVNEEKIVIDESSVLELARRSGDEELNILFIGNSITAHAVAEYWWGVWGMAATEADKDYVHTVTNSFDKYIDTHYELHSFVPWETEEYDRTSLLPSLNTKLNEKCDLIVVELGDNLRSSSQTVSDIQADYEDLFEYCSERAQHAKIVTVGNFLVVPQTEAAKSAACGNSGITLVDLNDIRNDPKYQCGMGALVNGDDGNLHPVDGVGVALHPGNYGMDKIGKRVIRAALGN